MEKYNTDITILIISKDNTLSAEMVKLAENEGYSYISAESFDKAAELLDLKHVDIVLSELYVGKENAFEIITHINKTGKITNTILLAEHPSAECVINALKYGAYDFIPKPAENDAIILALKRASENIRLRRDNIRHFKELFKLNQLKNEFLAVVSHDLRSPLSSITGYVNYLIKKGDLSELQERYLNVIRDISVDLYELVNQLLDISKVETGIINIQRVETNMAELINTSLNNFVLLGIDKNTRIVFFNRLENTHAMVDREKILQVLNNIISNSVKFTENGTITVTAESKNQHIHLSIEDTGIGMDKEQIDNLFTQYGYSPSRGTRGEKGNGLGLVICKKFIDLHKGSIELESELGRGTRFLITIPEK